jgi:uncharacterized protein DUF938
MACASHLLSEEGILLIYDPFQVKGRFTTGSNEEFHKILSCYEVPEGGVKDVADLEKATANHGMVLKEIIDTPANNYSLIFDYG